MLAPSSLALGVDAFVGVVGDWVAKALGPDILRWVIGLSFVAMAGWMLIPDKVDGEAAGGKQRFGVFGTTVVALFLAEMGDKTQIFSRHQQPRMLTYRKWKRTRVVLLQDYSFQAQHPRPELPTLLGRLRQWRLLAP